MLSPPENKSKSCVRLSYPCATNIGPPHCARQHASPGGTAVPPALRTLKFPAATLSTWHYQKKIQISFPSLIFVLSHLESRTAVLPSPVVPSNAIFASRRTACGPPTTLPLTCLILPHCQSRRGPNFPAAPAPTSLL